ncbi:MAG TPA: hypothetical protein VGC85_09755 [Chthoniobacterales bacterium]
MTASGMLLAENDAAIQQARLFHESIPPTALGVDANGNALPTSGTSAESDDSFGAQAIMKTQERPPQFVVTANGAFDYTSNAALTNRGTRDDVLGVVDAGFAWLPRLTSDLRADVSAHISLFRYNDITSLDFADFALGAGLNWTPRNFAGVNFFARYDFTELLDRSSNQILMEHAVTLGAQKTIALGRSHAFSFGLSGTGAVADPTAAQREVISGFANYHLDLTRNWSTDIFYRPAVHFYTEHGRIDFNQILSVDLRYRLGPAAEFHTMFSYGFNRSNSSVFDYDVITTGGSIAFTAHF